MKVRIGNQPVSDDMDRAEKQIVQELMKTVHQGVDEISEKQLKYAADIAQQAAIYEASQLFQVLADILDEDTLTGNSSIGLDARLLSQGASYPQDFSPLDGNDRGIIPWKDYSVGYSKWKERHYPDHYQQFFVLDQSLKSYFKGRADSIISSRFGGVRINVSPQTTELDDNFEADLAVIELGRVIINIFPDINSSLLPGLSSGRWTDTLENGDFERDTFSGLKTAAKLVQSHNDVDTYRALVAPAVQFWVLVRIPAAIFARLSKYFKKAYR